MSILARPMWPVRDELSLRHVTSGDWVSHDDQDFDQTAVEVMEKSDRNKHESCRSTLDDVIQAEDPFPHAVVFTTSLAVETWWKRQHPLVLPAEFRPVVSNDINGTFGCYYHRDAEGQVVAHDSWICFKIKQVSKAHSSFTIHHRWIQLAIFVRHHWKTSRQLVIFLNVPKDLKFQFQSLLPQVHRRNPYTWHAAFVNEVKKIYDQAIWDLRGIVFEVEGYQKAIVSFKPDFILLNDVARHISHCNEILSVAANIVDSAMFDQKELNSQLPPMPQPWDFHDAQNQLVMGLQTIHSTKLRCTSLNERMQNEINLAFNIVSQRNAEVSVQMSKSALSDNSMMKTVAVVSLIYLPGTFVSSIFGMNFFSFDRGVIVSDHFWLFWVITVLLTAMTLFVWLLCQYRDRVVQAILHWRKFQPCGGSGGNSSEMNKEQEKHRDRLPS